MPVVILIIVIIALVIIVNCVKIVPQAHAVVVERLGGYLTTWSVGLHFKVPFIDRIAKRVLLKEQVVDTVFGYPGGTILNVYDALYKQAVCIRCGKSNHGN